MIVKIDLSNYWSKSDLKNATGIDTCKLPSKSDLANLKSEVDKSDMDKFKNVPINLSNLKSKVDKLNIDNLAPDSVDLSKLSNVAKNKVVKKTTYNVQK